MADGDRNADLRRLIRTIPDHPKPGIQFRDITTLLLDPQGLALALGAGVLLIRKDGKLPGATNAEDYELEYGVDRIAIHVDAFAPGARVLLVDDLIATGGTARAAVRLLRKAGARVTQASFVIDLPDLGGADALRAEGIAVNALVAFEGD